MWACHNEREEDQSGSPRESRVTVSPAPKVVNKGHAGSAFIGCRTAPVDRSAHVPVLTDRHPARLRPVGQAVWIGAGLDLVITSPVAVSMTDTDP